MVERSSLMRLSGLTNTSLGLKSATWSFMYLGKGGNDDQVTHRRAVNFGFKQGPEHGENNLKQ